MTMPFFRPGDDPGPSFSNLLRRVGQPPMPDPGIAVPVTHATTCVAMRYADGVVMAGDRRATAGNLISHRAMEKVFPADRHTGVAIAGAAGPAMEMVKLFQLQLEHYEKVEGATLSLEGKANQLVEMVRGNLPAAMQGLVVVPLFAGYDLRREHGPAVQLRRHRRPLRGARLRRHRLGQPPRRHRRSSSATATGIDRDEAVDLACRALFEAADEDSATGGPDLVRGIYPDRRHHHRRRASSACADDELVERFRALLDALAANPGGPAQ